MRWQRWARAARAVAGLGCAAAIYFTTRDRPAAGLPPGPTGPIDEQAIQEGGAGTWYRGSAGRKRSEIDYARMAMYADGRTRFFKAHLITGDPDGAQLWADTIDAQTAANQTDQPLRADLNGNVRIVRADGFEAAADAATYDDRTAVLQIPGRLTFKNGRTSGDGMGGTYDRANNVLNIHDQAHFVVAPGEGGKGGMDATGRSMTFARVEKLLKLVENATLVQDGDTLRGDTAALYLTDDESQLRRIELRGHSAVAPGSAPGSRPPQMQADDIDLVFQPDGSSLQAAGLAGKSAPASMVLSDAGGRRAMSGSRLDLDLAPDGSTLTRLDATAPVVVQLPASGDTPAREIHALELISRGAPKTGLTTARFTGNVEFTEAPRAPPPAAPAPAGRRVTSRTLELKLKGKLDAIDSALFRENVEFKDGANRGAADAMTYNAVRQELLLRPATRTPGPGSRLPQVIGERMTVNAVEIDLQLESSDLHARQDVKTEMTPAQPASGTRRPTAIFEGDQPVLGASSELHYVGKVATYVGTGDTKAELRQADSVVSGDQVKLFTENDNLVADGHVFTRFMLAPARAPGAAAAPAAPSRHEVTADKLNYDDAKRVATFTGKPAKLTRAEGTTEAGEIVIELAQAARTVQRFVATGQVYSEEGKRSAVGEQLVYEAAAERYVLTGSPAKVKTPKDDPKAGCSIAIGRTLEFQRQSQPTGWSEVQNVPCETSIR
jgi:lipopolysaccharide export system protein LptA